MGYRKDVPVLRVDTTAEIDSRFDNVNAQLAQTETKVKLRAFNKYGNLWVPENFEGMIDFDVFRDKDGSIKHNFDLDAMLERWEATYIYVSENGNDSNDGLTESTPIRFLSDAFNLVENTSGDNFIIKILTPILTKTFYQTPSGGYSISKNVAIVADEKVTTGKIERGMAWTLEDGVYKSSKPDVTHIYDGKYKDYDGLPKKYKKLTTLQECKNNRGSFYMDDQNDIVYVNRINSEPINNEEVFVMIGDVQSIRPINITLTSNNTIIFKNLDIISRASNNLDAVRINGNPQNDTLLILDNTNIINSRRNGLATNDIKRTWCFESTIVDTFRDGFNYHGSVPNLMYFEYNCSAYGCGRENEGSGTDNATTCHDGGLILRINTIGYETRGPVLADVHGCISVCYDCVMHDSITEFQTTAKAAFQFSNITNSVMPETNGKAYLFNCSGGGDGTIPIVSGANIPVEVYSFNGRPDLTNPNIIVKSEV